MKKRLTKEQIFERVKKVVDENKPKNPKKGNTRSS